MTELVGILNLTPDSFSDGGKYTRVEDMIAAVDTMISSGARVIDVGAESTRPGATTLSATEEWERLQPFFDEVHPRYPGGVYFSLDTRHAENAAKALTRGVQWINDVSGFASSDMINAVKNSDCKLVLMHSLTVPADPYVTLPMDVDVVHILLSWIKTRLDTLGGYNISSDCLIFDPGIGFGKTAPQSLDILRRAGELKACGLPILIGHSRKSCLSAIGSDRDAATLAISQHLMRQGIDYLRVHDIAAHSLLKAVS